MTIHPRSHLKFVGWIQAVDTRGDVWTQRITDSNVIDYEAEIDWRLTKIPLPGGASQGHFVSVHRTKAGRWYAVDLSQRMPRLTESQIKRAEAWSRRMARLIDRSPQPTTGRDEDER